MTATFQKMRDSLADKEPSADFLQNTTMLGNEFVEDAKGIMLKLGQIAISMGTEILKQSMAKLKETA